MTFLQALYGSQHKELTDRGSDGAKGRFNANVFLTAFLILATIIIFLITFKASDSFSHSVNSGMSGYVSGRSIGKLLAIPVFAIIYFAIIKTIGSERNYQKLVAEFNELPDSEKAQANKKVLTPFFILLGIVMVLVIFF
jgi:hypothetical protein